MIAKSSIDDGLLVQLLQTLIRDKNVGSRVVPIVPDEARTFGMEAMFRSLGIYSVVGQKYRPEDSDQLAFYKEDIKGQILEEGITTEAERDVELDRRVHQPQQCTALQPDSVLHLLLDVRLPARR